jgi:FkbM family methyltransferase
MVNQETVNVTWGQKKTALVFDRFPYPERTVDADIKNLGDVGYEPEVINVLEHFLELGDCVIDAGACVGHHSCLMSKLVGSGGLVLAFEPMLVAFRDLVRHVHTANKLDNVACFKLALWKEDVPSLKLWSMGQTVGYSSFHHINPEASVFEVVEGCALDGLLGPKEHPRLIKIDCEGTEYEILLGAKNILTKGVDCVILEFNYHILKETNCSDREIRNFMAALGYDMFLININDNVNGGFQYPIKVGSDVTIELQGGDHINVMFSTQEKVQQRW